MTSQLNAQNCASWPQTAEQLVADLQQFSLILELAILLVDCVHSSLLDLSQVSKA
jgi:hypothetical protein